MWGNARIRIDFPSNKSGEEYAKLEVFFILPAAQNAARCPPCRRETKLGALTYLTSGPAHESCEGLKRKCWERAAKLATAGAETLAERSISSFVSTALVSG